MLWKIEAPNFSNMSLPPYASAGYENSQKTFLIPWQQSIDRLWPNSKRQKKEHNRSSTSGFAKGILQCLFATCYIIHVWVSVNISQIVCAKENCFSSIYKVQGKFYESIKAMQLRKMTHILVMKVGFQVLNANLVTKLLSPLFYIQKEISLWLLSVWLAPHFPSSKRVNGTPPLKKWLRAPFKYLSSLVCSYVPWQQCSFRIELRCRCSSLVSSSSRRSTTYGLWRMTLFPFITPSFSVRKKTNTLF